MTSTIADDRSMLKIAAKRIRLPTDLLKRARAASDSAYARYSAFSVGAALRCASGKIYSGCNVENVSYPLGICAEAAAIAAARLGEGVKIQILEIVVFAAQNGMQQPCSPCGGCRQRIAEFGSDVAVFFFGPGLTQVKQPISKLLPHTFTFRKQAASR